MLDVAEKITLLQQWCRCEIKMFPAIKWWNFVDVFLFRIPQIYCNMMQYDLLTWYVFCSSIFWVWFDPLFVIFMIYFVWRPNCLQPFSNYCSLLAMVLGTLFSHKSVRTTSRGFRCYFGIFLLRVEKLCRCWRMENLLIVAERFHTSHRLYHNKIRSMYDMFDYIWCHLKYIDKSI